MPTPCQAAAEGLPKFPGYEEAFSKIETPINRAFEISRVLVMLSDDLDIWEQLTPVALTPPAMKFLISELYGCLKDLDALHLHLHNAGLRAGRGETA